MVIADKVELKTKSTNQSKGVHHVMIRTQFKRKYCSGKLACSKQHGNSIEQLS